MRISISYLVIFLLLSGMAFGQSTVKKSALIIGNSNYITAPLSNPVNDAVDLSNTLEKLGFKVFLRTNLSKREMRSSIIEYGDYVNDNPGIALFYFAGHGIQKDGTNYLLPTDFNVQRSWEIEDESVRMDVVLRMLEAYKNPANLVILDACRNNPFLRSFRDLGTGLANPQYNLVGTLIAYATAPGQTASDGDGRNGLYTQELIKL